MFSRIANWFAGEVITKTLVRNEKFQRFAANSHETVTKIQQKSSETISKVSESNAAKIAMEQLQEKTKVASTFKDTFMDTMKKEISKLEQEGLAAAKAKSTSTNSGQSRPWSKAPKP